MLSEQGIRLVQIQMSGNKEPFSLIPDVRTSVCLFASLIL